MIELGVFALVVGAVMFVVGVQSLDRDWAIMAGGVVAVVGVFILIFAAVVSANAEHDRLMKQCMADGHPEYECVSKLKQDTVPVFIPIGR